MDTQAPLTCPIGEDRHLRDFWHGHSTPGCNSHLNLSSRYDSEAGGEGHQVGHTHAKGYKETPSPVMAPIAQRMKCSALERLRVRCVHSRGLISHSIAIAGTRHALSSMFVVQERVNIRTVGGSDRCSSVLVQSESLWHINNRNC